MASEVKEIHARILEFINDDTEFTSSNNHFVQQQEQHINYHGRIHNDKQNYSKMSKKQLNVNDCKIILKDVYKSSKIITIEKIQNVTSNFFSINLQEMLSQRRSRPLARPRQIAMYLAKKLTTRSLPEIGRRFANRDHTTVIHAVKTITRLSEQDDEMKKNISQIKILLLEQ